MRNGNVSAFNGGHFTPSDYSLIKCEACGRHWRTKAAYVTTLPDNPPVPGPSPDSVVFGPDKAPPATPEERLLLAIYGRNPDDANEVRGLRDHAVTCTREDHTWCFPYPAQAAPELDDPGDEAETREILGDLDAMLAIAEGLEDSSLTEDDDGNWHRRPGPGQETGT